MPFYDEYDRDQLYVIDNPKEVTQDTKNSSPSYYPGERGFLSGTASGIVRGVADAASSVGAGLEELGFDNSIREKLKVFRENWDPLKPDIPEAFGMEQGVYGTIKRLPQNIARSVTTPVLGYLAGTVVSGGNPVVAGAAGVGAMAVDMGFGIKREKVEEYLAKNPGDIEGAEAYGNIHGAANFGFELASDAITAVTFGTSSILVTGVKEGLKNLTKAGVKSTAREMLKFSAKKFGEEVAISTGAELSTELATSYVEGKADEAYGMGPASSLDVYQDTAITTIGMSLVFAAVGAKYQHGKRKQLRDMLDSGDVNQQLAASNLISKELTKSGDIDLAASWNAYASSKFDRGLPLSLDDNYIELGNKISQEKTMPGDILSTNPEIQKNAVDQILAKKGIGEDGGPVSGPETFEDSLNEFLPETQEAKDARIWREGEAKAAADVYYKGEPKRALGDIFTGASLEDINAIARAPGIIDTPRQPSPTLSDIETADIERARVQEKIDAKKFEELSLAYRQAKNNKDRVTAWKMLNDFRAKTELEIEDRKKSATLAHNKETNWEIEKQMKKGEERSSGPPTPDEARAIVDVAYKNIPKKTLAELVDTETATQIETLRNSTDTQIRSLMLEVEAGSNNLPAVVEKAKGISKKAIKGSKRATEAEAVITTVEKIETAVVAKGVTEVGSVAEAAPLAPTTKRRKAADKVTNKVTKVVAEPTAEYTVDDTITPDNTTVGAIGETKGVESATNLTPEKALEIKEAQKATLKVRKKVEMEEAKKEAAIPDLDKAIADSKSPLLAAVKGGSTKAINSLFPKDATGPMKKTAILKAFRNLGADIVRKHATTVKELIEKAISGTTLVDTKNLKGALRKHAIDWETESTGAKKINQVGYRKNTKTKVEIENTTPDKKMGIWDIRVGGKVVDTVKGQTAARLAAEKYVEPLSASELAEQKKQTNTRTAPAALTAEDKVLLQRYEESQKVNVKDKEAVEKEKVADVIKIDPKTGERTIIAYTPPTKEVAKGLTKSDKVVRELTREEELAALLEEQEMDTDEAFLVNNYSISPALVQLLKDVKGNLDRAYQILTNSTSSLTDLKYVEEEIRNRNNNESELASIFQNADTALSHVVKNGTELEKTLAKLILKNTTVAKRQAINFKTNLNGPKNSYNNETNTITLTSDNTGIALHEFIHGVTVREMSANPKLKAEVNNLLSKVKEELRQREQDGKEGGFTQAQIDYINKNNTSTLFKNNNPEALFFGDSLEIAYGLINVNEFMAQSLSKASMIEMMKSIPLKNPRGLIQTLWDTIVAIVGDTLGLSRLHHNALSELLILGVQAMEQKKVSTKSTGINESFVSKVTNEFVEKEVGKYTTEHPTSETLKESIVGGLKGAERTFSDTVQKLYTSIADISVPLAEKVQRLDFDSLTALTRRVDETLSFDKKVKKLTDKEQKELFIYLNNYDAGTSFSNSLNKFLSKMGMIESFGKTTNMLKELYQEAEKFGLNKYEEVDNYFPRKIKDLEGLTSYLRKQEDWGVMDEALKIERDRYLKKNGKEMSSREEADVLGRMLATGRLPASYLRNPTGTKQRSIKVVNADMMKFYYSPIEALGMHIQEMTERIEINRMLGVTDMKNTKADIKKTIKEIRKLTSEKADPEVIKTASERLQKLRDSIPDMAAQIDNSIGDIAAKLVKERKITEDQQSRVKELIRARITEVGVGRKIGIVRQAALVGTLTQVGTGLRQMSDHVWSMYRNGVFNTLQAAINVATGKSIIKENFIDFQMPLKEFDSMNSMVDKVLKFSGIAFMDNLGKKISMEASQIASKKMSREDFIKKWSYAYGESIERTGRVYDDIQSGVVNNEVKYLVTSVIAKDQPIFKSSQSRYQLQAGNARIFWFLKSYAISSANSFYNESIGEIRKGNIKEGLQNLATLGTLFVLMGAGSDWLVDMLYGKKPDLSKSAVDTLLSLVLMSQYSVDKSKKEGFFRTFAGQIIPPLNLLDFPTTDVFNLISGDPTFKTLKLLPAVGTIAYNRMTDAGQKSVINASKKDIYLEAVSGTLPSSDISELNSKIREYNTGKKKDKQLAPITSGTIAAARKKEMKKNAQ